MSESPDKRKRSGWWMVVFVVLVPQGLYLAGYFWLGEYQRVADGPHVDAHFRCYPSNRIRDVYRPLGRLEAALRGERVLISAQPQSPPRP